MNGIYHTFNKGVTLAENLERSAIWISSHSITRGEIEVEKVESFGKDVRVYFSWINEPDPQEEKAIETVIERHFETDYSYMEK
jgi:hypothetical protein